MKLMFSNINVKINCNVHSLTRNACVHNIGRVARDENSVILRIDHNVDYGYLSSGVVGNDFVLTFKTGPDPRIDHPLVEIIFTEYIGHYSLIGTSHGPLFVTFFRLDSAPHPIDFITENF